MHTCIFRDFSHFTQSATRPAPSEARGCARARCVDFRMWYRARAIHSPKNGDRGRSPPAIVPPLAPRDRPPRSPLRFLPKRFKQRGIGGRSENFEHSETFGPMRGPCGAPAREVHTLARFFLPKITTPWVHNAPPQKVLGPKAIGPRNTQVSGTLSPLKQTTKNPFLPFLPFLPFP